MGFYKKLLNKLHRDFYNYNIIRTNQKEWHGEKLIINNARIMGNVMVGDGCKIIDGVQINASSPVRIGNYTSINGPNTDVFSRIHSVTIGNFCSIARNVSIQEFNHPLDRITSYFIFLNIFGESINQDIQSKGSVEIGHDVWIGAHCVIVSGAKIGNGAIIAANSVVTGTIPDFAIAGGSPARVIKYRFDEEIIKRLQQLQWWQWPVERIKRNRQLFESKLTVEKLEQIKA